MRDLIITGASRGIGRALALAVAARPASPTRLVLVARDEGRLREVAGEAERAGASVLCVPGDLSGIASSRALGERLASVIASAATLVHNAGIWPARRVLTADGLESAFATNFVGPLLLQQPLLERGLLDRVMVVSAGLIALGRYSADRTPAGLDFSSWRTYCTTKLAFAVAERGVAARHPGVDFVVLHPGVVRTDLGARPGLLGALLDLTKRLWESPERCASRLRELLARERWSPAGRPCWLVGDRERPWPATAEDPGARQAVEDAVVRVLGSRPL